MWAWNLLQAAQSNAALAQQYTSILWVMTIVSLVFLFGERGIKNVMPLIERVFLARGEK